MTHLLRPVYPMARALVGLLLLIAVGSPAFVYGDVIHLKNGRQVEGKIVDSNPSSVKVDAVLSGTRVTFRLAMKDIARIEKKPLPEGYFNTEVKAAHRVSDAKSFPPDAHLYLEVPIVGRFGSQVVPQGVSRSLSYATRHGIQHIVFFVDSQGGDQILARRIFEILARYDNRLTYHALVRDAVGVSMAVAVWCDNVFMLPGANLGGILIDPALMNPDENPEFLLSQVAYRAGGVAGNHGWSGELVRAMIDPAERVAAWYGRDNTVEIGVRIPASVAPQKIILKDVGEELVTLSRSEAVHLNQARPINGRADQIGTELGLSNWIQESDYGRQAMMEAASEYHRKMARAEARHDARIAKLSDKMQSTKAYIDRYLSESVKWAPQNATYSTYEEATTDSWRNSWGPASGPEMNREEKAKWRQRSDFTLRALARTRKGVLEMQKLQRRAVREGLEPLYPEDELEDLLENLENQAQVVYQNRNRKFK
ncbi:MAG: hypothetical protein V3T77_02840 [Planctomycetota bacterium]